MLCRVASRTCAVPELAFFTCHCTRYNICMTCRRLPHSAERHVVNTTLLRAGLRDSPTQHVHEMSFICQIALLTTPGWVVRFCSGCLGMSGSLRRHVVHMPLLKAGLQGSPTQRMPTTCCATRLSHRLTSPNPHHCISTLNRNLPQEECACYEVYVLC